MFIPQQSVTRLHTLTSIPGSRNTVLLSGVFSLGVRASGLNFLVACGEVEIDLRALKQQVSL